MQVTQMSRDELSKLFSDNISDLVTDDEVHEHIVGVLGNYIEEKELPIKEEKLDSVIINELFEQKEMGELIKRGDAYLFMCGFFPEYLSKKRKAGMGIKFYIEKGIDSYNFALSLSYTYGKSDLTLNYKHTTKQITAGLVSKLSDYFVDNINILIKLRTRLQNYEVILDPELFNELHTTIGYKPDLRKVLVIKNPNYEPKEKYVMNNGHLKRVK